MSAKTIGLFDNSFKIENRTSTQTNFQQTDTQKLSCVFLSSFQHAKKVVSDSPGLVDFAIGLMNSVFNLPDGQVMFYEEFE